MRSLSDLGYNTSYILRYYSENLAGMRSDTVEYSFTTDKKAPEMPAIQILDHAGEQDGLGHDITTTVYAYSTEIQWKNTEPDIDSIRVSLPVMAEVTIRLLSKLLKNRDI